MKKIALLLVFILALSAAAAFVLNELSGELGSPGRHGVRKPMQSDTGAINEVRIQLRPSEPSPKPAGGAVPETVPESGLFRLKHRIGAVAQFFDAIIGKIRF